MPIKMPASSHAQPGGQWAGTRGGGGDRRNATMNELLESGEFLSEHAHSLRTVARYITSGAETPMIFKPLRNTCCTALLKLKRALRKLASSIKNLYAL